MFSLRSMGSESSTRAIGTWTKVQLISRTAGVKTGGNAVISSDPFFFPARAPTAPQSISRFFPFDTADDREGGFHDAARIPYCPVQDDNHPSSWAAVRLPRRA